MKQQILAHARGLRIRGGRLARLACIGRLARLLRLRGLARVLQGFTGFFGVSPSPDS